MATSYSPRRCAAMPASTNCEARSDADWPAARRGASAAMANPIHNEHSNTRMMDSSVEWIHAIEWIHTAERVHAAVEGGNRCERRRHGGERDLQGDSVGRMDDHAPGSMTGEPDH